MEDVFKFGLSLAFVLGGVAFLAYVIPLAMRNFRKARYVDGDNSGELELLRAEVDDLRSLQPRMAELEERLDFAERLLAQRDAERLPRGRDD